MSILYAGWGSSPAIQSTDSSKDLYYNSQALAGGREFLWMNLPGLSSGTAKDVLAITVDRSYAGEASSAKVMVGPQLSNTAEFYVRVSLELPAIGAPMGFHGDWFQVFEIYGPPYAGSPTINLLVNSDQGTPRWAFDQQARFSYPARRAWLGPPVVFDQRHDIILHVRLSTGSKTGLVELWFDGVRQTFVDGTQTLHYQTVDTPNAKGPQRLIIDQYGPAPVYADGPYTLFHGSPVFGTTLADVTPLPPPPAYSWRLHCANATDQQFATADLACAAAVPIVNVGNPVFITRESSQ